MCEKRKSIKRTHPADAANIYVRNLLCEISEMLGGFSEKDLKRTSKFFDNKCPYTGKNLTKKNSVLDHIEPHNREYCGLHLYGNVIPCLKKANATKSNKGFENFINSMDEISKEEKQKRINKIREFITQSNYLTIKQSINSEIKAILESEYQNIKLRSVKLAEEICGKTVYLEEVEKSLKNLNIEKEEHIVKWNSNPKLNCHKIIAIYLKEIESNKNITRDYFVSIIDKYNISKNSLGAINSLMTDSGNNYGRIFMEDDDKLVICPDVEDYITKRHWII